MNRIEHDGMTELAMENFTITDKNSSKGDYAEDIKTIAKSYLIYKIGKSSFVVSEVQLPEGFTPVFLGLTGTTNTLERSICDPFHNLR